jgi:hypothetical protein
MASATRGRLFGQNQSKKSFVERISEFEAAGVGEIFFCLLTTAPAERIEEMGREIVSRY